MKLERRALGTAAVAAALGVALACFEPRAAPLAYRFALFSCLAPALGCLILVLIHRTTGGQWTAELAPFLKAGAGLVPWVWLCALPLLWLSPRPASGYESLPWAALRAGIYAAGFFWLRWIVCGGARCPQRAGRGRQPDQRVGDNALHPADRPWAGPVGLIVVFFLLTFLADDWLESLESHWHSTGFPTVWICGQVVSGLSLALLGGLRAGARPAASGTAGRALGLDWGNLLLATMVFWCYVAFAQFLIIWAGDLPDETSWYRRREQGAWAAALPLVAVFGFAFPFLLLLSRRLKRTAVGLACAAGLLLATQAIYLAWAVLPSGGPATGGGALLNLCFLAAGGGLFVNRYFHAAGRREGAGGNGAERARGRRPRLRP